MTKTSSEKHRISIIIPARYHSTRLPGKPLADIAGKKMIERVWEIAHHVCQGYANHPQVELQACITSEDQRIIDHCERLHMPSILTSEDCRSGTARVAQAATQLEQQPDFVINLQGDNALCPPWFLDSMIKGYIEQPDKGVITPYVQLTWAELDQLRLEKQQTPFSGTCVVFNTRQEAFWFSKNIIPAIRKEQQLREQSQISPVTRHIGLYGYDMTTLQQILELPESDYESLEGLEQLSFLEAGIKIRMVQVDYRGRQGMTGIDSPDDITRAEHILAQDGEFFS